MPSSPSDQDSRVPASLPHPTGSLVAGRSSFAARLDGRDNAFGLLRLVFAGMVVVSHAFPVGGFGPDPVRAWTHGQTELGTVGLYGFFAISGYLITTSARTSDSLAFLWRRLLRLYPAFIVALVVGAFVVGPLAELREGGVPSDYWSGPQGPVDYVVANSRLAIVQYGIHDVFLDDPYGAIDGSVVNGSLWTLWYEFRAYLVVGLLAAWGVLTRARWVVPASSVLAFALAQVSEGVPGLGLATVGLFANPRGLELLAVFLVGASIATYEHRIVCRATWATGATVLALATASTAGFRPLGLVAVAYLTLYAAATLPPWARRVGRRTDISYGVYVYGWPVLALLTTYGANRAGYGLYLGAALLAVAVLGWLSWHVVEKRALGLKTRGPGRGWAWVPVVGRHIADRRVASGAAGTLLVLLAAAVL